jgi:hypothetical protein
MVSHVLEIEKQKWQICGHRDILVLENKLQASKINYELFWPYEPISSKFNLTKQSLN